MFTLSAFADEIDPDPQKQIDVLKQCGVRHIELRSILKTNVLDLTDLQVAELKSLLDRHDFAGPDAPWLVVLFTSKNCDSCAGLLDKALPLASDQVSVTEVEYPANRALHERYHIDAAPITVLADDDGVTRASFVGAFTATDLWKVLAELRST